MIEAPIANVEAVLSRLPPRESDYVSLYYLKGKTQEEIAIIFGVRQPSVALRLKRARERIRYLEALPKIDARALEEQLSRVFDAKTVRLLTTLVRYDGHQRRTAYAVRVSYQAVCVALRRSILRLEKLAPIAPSLSVALALLKKLAEPTRFGYFEHGTFRRKKRR